MVHRDIKPANVMVALDGTVKVLDFGLAAQIQSSLSRVSQIHYGTSGTGAYMAPEQWRGQLQDGATDQYALAVLAYELLSGRLPFEVQDQVALRESAIRDAPEKPEGVSDNLWAALSRGLAKQRADRCANCAELVDALEGKKIAPARRSEAAGRPGKSRKGLVLAGAVGVGLLVLGVGGWYVGVKLPQQRAAAESRRVADEKAKAAEQERQAKLKAEADAYAALGTSRTEASLSGFLANHANGIHATEAKAELDKLVAERKQKEEEAKKLAAEAAAKEVAKETARQSKLKEEFDAYLVLQANKTEAGMAAFLERFADGAHAAEIKDALAKLKLEQAKQKEEFDAYVMLQANKTEAGMAAFLERFPGGAHVKELKDELLKLKQQQEAKAAEEAKRKAMMNAVRGTWEMKFDNHPQTKTVQITQDGQNIRLTSDSGVAEMPAWNLSGTFKDGAMSLAETRNYKYKVSGADMNETLRMEGTLSNDGLTIKGSFHSSGTVSVSVLFIPSTTPYNSTSAMTMTRRSVEPSTGQGTSP